MDKYKRPYCENCELIWGKQAYNEISICSDCNQDLILKSFNPWTKVAAGLGLIAVVCFTLLIDSFPLIWIGGAYWGGSLIFNAIKQWVRIQKLDAL